MRRTLALALAAATVTALAAPLVAASPATAAPVCRVDYRVAAQWAGGFQADVALTNLSGADWPSWTVSFRYTAGQRIRQPGYGVTVIQEGDTVTVTGPSWAPGLRNGRSTRFGLSGTWAGSNPPPTDVRVNGRPCDEPPPPVVDNPYAGADGYVNPDWSAQVAAAAGRDSAAGGDLGPAMSIVARQPTAVWLDSVEAITEGRGLRGHLDAALAQRAAAGRPVVVTLVLYDLPNRACLRAPGGDFDARTDGVNRYRTEFVDPIVGILAEPRYRDLRIAVVVEPLAMIGQFAQGPVVTESCVVFQQTGTYLNTIPYALGRLHEVPNVYAYLDAAQSNTLGWPTRLGPAAELLRQAAGRTPAGVASVDGFAVNVTDYDPVEEPFLDIGMTVNGTPIKHSRFVDFNDHLEERTYVDALHAALVARGFPALVGMLVDTSRNGWGGNARPVTPTNPLGGVDVFMEANRVDRRHVRYTWCNQVGAGLGERPRAAPLPRVHAYAWVKPPGESDGTSTSPMEVVERQCDPNLTMPPIAASAIRTNAMPGATPRGVWFDAAFTELVRNAHPALVDVGR